MLKRNAVAVAAIVGGLAMSAATADVVQADYKRWGRSVGNVYVMDNNPDGNRVVVYSRFANGALRQIRSVRTGGAGFGQNAAADPLGSQDSIILSKDKNFLYAVNNGDNTISVFKIRRNGVPALIQTLGSEGLSPVSLTTDGDVVYVLNAAGEGNVAGFRANKRGRLTYIEGSSRSLGLDVGPDLSAGANVTAPGDISFDTLNRRIVVTNFGGSNLFTFAVNDDGTLSDAPLLTTVGSETAPGTPFAVEFSDNGTAVVAQAAGFVSSFNFDTPIDLAGVSAPVANGQGGTCWIRIDGDKVFVTNTGSGTISVFTITRNGQLELLDATAATTLQSPIDFDITSSGRFIYVVSALEGGVRAFRVGKNGNLRDIGLFRGLPTLADDGFSPQGLAVR